MLHSSDVAIIQHNYVLQSITLKLPVTLFMFKAVILKLLPLKPFRRHFGVISHVFTCPIKTLIFTFVYGLVNPIL